MGAMAHGPPQQAFLTAPSPGGPGAPTLPSTSGQLTPPIAQSGEAQMNDVLELLIDRIGTPIGEMIIVADSDGNLRVIDWTDHEARMHIFLRRHYGRGHYGNDGFTLTPARNPNGLTDAIRRYFAGDLTAIDNLPVKTNGTPF